MSRLALALGLAAIGAAFLAASYTARPVQAATCVLVVGYSNTTQWFRDGGFESKSDIVNGEWESIAEGGSHVMRLAYENGYNWDLWAANSISSRCALNDRTPTTVLFDVAFLDDGSLTNGVTHLTAAVARARSELGFSGPMILKPMVGASDACNNWSTVAAPQTRDLIATVVAGDPSLSAGPYLTIPCSLFRAGDSRGHFSDIGKVEVARQIAAWWTGLSSVPTATPTPTPTPTTTPVLVSCERVATYSDGSKVTVALPLGDC